MKKILVCGIPRSGTTWISNVLSVNEEVEYIHEPDNEHQNLLSFVYKDELRRFPYLGADDNCEKYKTLFEKAYNGYYLEPYDRPSNTIRDLFSIDLDELELRIQQRNGLEKRTEIMAQLREYAIQAVVLATSYLSKIKSMASSGCSVKVLKSVHCLLALEFLNERLSIEKTLVVFRHPASILSSHLRMNNKDIWRPILQKEDLLDDSLEDYRSKIRQLDSELAKAGARIGAIYYLLQQYQENKRFLFVKYESICRDRVQKFKQLYQYLDLTWSERVEEYIHQLNREGEGYSVNRIAEEQIDKWEKELSASQIAAIERGYRIFPTDLQYQF